MDGKLLLGDVPCNIDRLKLIAAGKSQLLSFRQNLRKKNVEDSNQFPHVGKFAFPENLGAHLQKRLQNYSKFSPELASRIKISLDLPDSRDEANTSALSTQSHDHHSIIEEYNAETHSQENHNMIDHQFQKQPYDSEERTIAQLYDHILCLAHQNSSITPVILQHLYGCVEQLKGVHNELKNRPKYASVMEVLLTKVNGLTKMVGKKEILEKESINLFISMGKPIDFQQSNPDGKNSSWMSSSKYKEIEARLSARNEGNLTALESENQRMKEKIKLFQQQIKHLQQQEKAAVTQEENKLNGHAKTNAMKMQQTMKSNLVPGSNEQVIFLKRSLEEKDALVDAMRHSLKMVVMEKEEVGKELQQIKLQMENLQVPNKENHTDLNHNSLGEAPMDTESPNQDEPKQRVSDNERRTENSDRQTDNDNFPESLKQSLVRAQKVIDQSLMSPSVDRQSLLLSNLQHFDGQQSATNDRTSDLVQNGNIKSSISRPIVKTLHGHRQIKMHGNQTAFPLFSFSWIYQLFGSRRRVAEKYNKHGAFIL